MTPSAQKVICDGLSSWAPVRLPEAGVNLFLPCSDKELAAYRNANETRKNTAGLAGCERDGKTYVVIYAVNTPPNFFDGYASRLPEKTKQQFQVSNHKIVRSSEYHDGLPSASQLIEIDSSRAIIMSAHSLEHADADFGQTASCFFNSFGFTGK